MSCKITNDIRNQFKSLQTDRNLDAIIEYLSSILSINDADNLLAGFCYWNISDSYAIGRKSEELYANHLDFCKMLDTMDSKYKFWSVCDATQRFTLELGGHSDFWWELYKNAVDSNSNITGIERIVFDTHVSAISINPKVDVSLANLQFAREQLGDFVRNYSDSDCTVFYKLVHSSLCLKAFGDEEYDILNLCNIILPWLKEEKVNSIYAVGEWESLNRPRSKCNMARIGINRAVNAFIDVDKKDFARDLYNTAKNNGLPSNTYIEKRI